MTNKWFSLLLASLLCLLSRSTPTYGVEQWSRQLEPGTPNEGDSSLDWVPLVQPVDGESVATKDRSANARVLTYSQTFPPSARFGDLPKSNVPLASTQGFDFPYQFHRFGNPPHSLRGQVPPAKSGSYQSQEPTSQSFFKFEMPYHGEGSRLQGALPSVQTGYQIQHSFGNGNGQATLFSSQHYNQPPLFPGDFHPVPQKPLQQPLQNKPSLTQQNFIEDTLPIKSTYRDSKPLTTQASLQSVTPQTFPQNPQPETLFEITKPSSFQAQAPYHQSNSGHSSSAQQEEVQLLYVPYDTLFNQQQQSQPPTVQSPSYGINKFNLNSGLPDVNPYQINQFYTQDPILQEPNFFTTSTTSRPKTTSVKPTNVFQNFVTPQYSAAKPKPKAHQPPLAMFLLRNSARPTQSDVVSALHDSNTIDVIDAPSKDTPKVFVGPAGMPIPNGFVKFDLPYLSQLSQARDLNEVPFFVAPLSYRTPNGFNKILLPEPHVGSIVVNRARDYSAEQPIKSQPSVIYNPPTQNIVKEYPATTQRPRAHSQRIKQPTTTRDYYPEIMREPNQKQRQPEVTTQRATLLPGRGNKFSYYIDQDAIEEVTSPKIPKQERPKKKRPQTVQVEQPIFTQTLTNPYNQFNSVPNQISNDEYFKLQLHKSPASTSTSTSTSTTSTSTTTTTTTPPPSTYFPLNSNPQVEFHSSNGQLYPSYNTILNEQISEHAPRFTTRPPIASSPEEEYRMKQYYRQQDAFRNRPQNNNPTYSPFEQVQYTPIEVSIPSTTSKIPSNKQRITYYSPTETTTSTEIYDTVPPRDMTEKILPVNHRPSYNQNEISDGNVEYDPNPYELPSELPPLTPNLPGLVNDLQEKNKAHVTTNDQITTITPFKEPETPSRPTRRPINRVRKPVLSKVTSSVTYSESESSTKRPATRIRRPYRTRGSINSEAATSEADESMTTTRRPTSVERNPIVRNPNRIRYRPTTEERQSLHLKTKKRKGGNKGSDSEDLDYQRDVLKQNYPVFRPSSSSSRNPTSPTAIPSSYVVTMTEGPTSETQQVYTVTPSNSEQIFPAGMLEPMQIAQQYNTYSKDNYGPGYFPNQEDLSPTEPVIRNEINPVYTATASTIPSSTTSTTTTTEGPVTTTRHSLFTRRNYPRLRPTTTESPVTTTQNSEEKPSIRARIPPRKVIKVRTRNRRPPHPASSTTVTPEEQPEPQPVKNNYRKLNRFNQDLYDNEAAKRRFKPHFHLEGQESQWSPSVKADGGENFNPINPKDASNNDKHDFENEPEIVTADPERDENQSDNYEVQVSANFGSPGKSRNASLKAPNLRPEKSFAELLEEVMGKAPMEKPLESETETTARTTDGTYFESQKTTIGNRINRRGKWKKLRSQASVHQNDSFETAESQNIGEQLLNTLYANRKDLADKLRTTTPLSALETTTESVPSVTQDNTYEAYTTNQPELSTAATTVPTSELKTSTLVPESKTEDSATRRFDVNTDMLYTHTDDLETQPSIFSEVKKQLHDLFAIEDSEDQAVTAALTAVNRRRQEYKNIKRTRPPLTTTESSPTEDTATTQAIATLMSTPATVNNEKNEFHADLMDHVVYATSTSTKVSSETEICYRGRCIRSEDLPANHKLQ